MFMTLLVVTFIIALISASAVAWLFDKPVAVILKRIVPEELGSVWHRS